MEYAFLIYSSSKNFHGTDCYEYGFANRTYSIVGDKPFSRGDVVQIQSCQKESRNEYRITVRVLGDPRINSGEEFDSSRRIELPTLIFLSSRIYLSEFCDYEVVDTLNARILSFDGVQQDRNRIYAVAALVTGSEAYIVAREKSIGTRFEWFISDRDTLRRTSFWKDRY